MGWWTERVVPRVVDVSCGNAVVRPHRERACVGLQGRVLELGFGSGLNTDLYPPAVTEVLAVELSDVAWAMSEARRAASPAPVRRIGLDGARLDLADASVDAVLSTFTLCTIPDVSAALAEARRVLVPGGTVHVVEHGLSPDAGTARWQHRLDGLQQRLCGGCHLTREPAALLADAGFVDVHLQGRPLPGPRLGCPWTYVTSGSARRSTS